ncbi:hypothetical protein [Cognatiyoonia sp. IB215446]|uniref:hypothetical protein n=1 Tax=Cognatiyoonia sp. IB215446 TaxID=3097355 RepID=UPI0039B78446
MPEEYRKRVEDHRTAIVAVAGGDKPIAFIELKAGRHIDCFCCHSDFAGMGFGQAHFHQCLQSVHRNLAPLNGGWGTGIFRCHKIIGSFAEADVRRTANVMFFERKGGIA